MAKIGSGVVSVFIAVLWLLFAFGYESNGRNPWLFAMIPAFVLFDYRLPRILVLFCAAGWTLGGIAIIADGLKEMIALRNCVKKLRSGVSPEQLFEESVNGTTWSNKICKLSAESILRGKLYSKVIPALVKVSGDSLDSVVLQYKLVVDALLKRSRQIQQATAKIGISAAGLPSLSFPCVLVTEPQKRTMYDRLTKVDLSATNNATALLSTGDLIYSYNGELVNSIERLQELVIAWNPTKNAIVGVLRYIKTSNPHPLTGMAAEYSWQALQFEIPGGTIEAGLEDSGQPT